MANNKDKALDKVQRHQIVTDMLMVTLNNLSEIPDGLRIVDEIIELLPYSPMSNYDVLFKHVKDFYVINGSFPSIQFLMNDFKDNTNLMYDIRVTHTPYSFDTIIYLINCLREYKKHRRLEEALAEFDLDKAKQVLSEDILIDDDKDTVSMDNIYDAYERMKNSPKGLLLGIDSIDNYMKGMDYGTLNVIAAPTGAGKTTLAISTAYNAVVKEGRKVIYFTFEVTPQKIYFDLLSRHSLEMGYNIPAVAIKKAELTPQQEEDLKVVIEDWKNIVNSNGGSVKIIGRKEIKEYTPAFLEALITSKKHDMGGLDMVYIDHINLLKNNAPKSLKLDQYEALNFYTQMFTELSIKHHYILVLLCQINRVGTDKLNSQDSKDKKETNKTLTASTTFFAEANEIERSASTAMILYSSPSMRNMNKMRIFLVKNRDNACPDGAIETSFRPEFFSVGEKTFDTLTRDSSGIMNYLENNVDTVDSMTDDLLDMDNFNYES